MTARQRVRASVPWSTHSPGTSAPQPPAWIARGECRHVDPEVFFPPKGHSPREAKQVCMSCPVRAECLEWALSTRQEHGISGGMTAREREDLLNGAEPKKPAQQTTRPFTDAEKSRGRAAINAKQTAKRDARVEEYFDLLSLGYSKREARDRLGITERTACRYQRIQAERTNTKKQEVAA
mgnify:CR=1 FL=1